MKAIITYSDRGYDLANKLLNRGFDAEVVMSNVDIVSLWKRCDGIVFIGALGICVRKIASLIKDKRTDPAVVNIDVNGEFVQSVVSGHVGGANNLAYEIAKLINATPVITTTSDVLNFWPLDTIHKKYNWKVEVVGDLNKLIAKFINKGKTALLIEVRDKGTMFLESTLPPHVQVYYSASDFNSGDYDIVIAVTHYLYDFNNAIFYRPQLIHIGVGCQKDIALAEFKTVFLNELVRNNISYLSIADINTIDIKKNEKALVDFCTHLNVPLNSYSEQLLSKYKTPNPSTKVKDVTGSSSVAEAATMHSSGNKLLVEKQKVRCESKWFTYAIAIDRSMERTGFIEFVGAGPGDPELISVRGKQLLHNADLILYAGSLVPRELLRYAKEGCVIENSASMNLQQQINIMSDFYKRNLYVVRLHTGDPCIYGAIQEQMSELDKLNFKYSITPGISSFQAAAAALRSQFTIPGEVQTIILTRGEGRTLMPDREKLHKLAAFQSTMCIYLSASIVDKIQDELLVHYPPQTPVAVCYKLTWSDEKIFRCSLDNLADTVNSNNLTMTTLIVVGNAIDNRRGNSDLYNKNFSHAFRKGI